MLSFDVDFYIELSVEWQQDEEGDWTQDADNMFCLNDRFIEVAEAYLELKGRMDGLEK